MVRLMQCILPLLAIKIQSRYIFIFPFLSLHAWIRPQCLLCVGFLKTLLFCKVQTSSRLQYTWRYAFPLLAIKTLPGYLLCSSSLCWTSMQTIPSMGLFPCLIGISPGFPFCFLFPVMGFCICAVHGPYS